jgi:hypothetical protein
MANFSSEMVDAAGERRHCCRDHGTCPIASYEPGLEMRKSGLRDQNDRPGASCRDAIAGAATGSAELHRQLGPQSVNLARSSRALAMSF